MKDESCSSNGFTSQEGLQAASVASFDWAPDLWLTWFRKSTFGLICLPRAHGFFTVSAYLIYSLTWELLALYSLMFIGFLFECKMMLSSVFLGFFDWPWLACEEDDYSGEMDSPSDDRIGITHPSDIIYQWKEWNVYPSMSETPRAFLAGRAFILKHYEPILVLARTNLTLSFYVHCFFISR